MRSLVIVSVLASLGGCDWILGKELNPAFCAAHPDQAECARQDGGGDGSDAAGGCTADPQCSAPTAVCELGSRTCVQCTAAEPQACVGMAPVCATDDQCRACAAHDECASNACLPDGSCGTDANVAYVDPAGTDNTSCTKATPCTKVAKALATNRAYVKLHGATAEQVTINNQDVTLLADPGAQLSASSPGVILTVMGTSDVSIRDLAISNGLGSTGIGVSMPPGNTATLTLTSVKLINNAGGGISASGGSLTVTRSTISNNTGGGIALTNAAFVIVNNMFFGNGTGSGNVGGISISTTQNAQNRLDFNSFNKNTTQDGLAPAIQCFAGTFTARNNIMSGNGTLTNMNQTGGTCAHVYSIATPGTLPTGTGNIALDPMFANTTTGDLHLQNGSPAIDAADPASNLTGPSAVDFDGESRPQGIRADIGADEHP